MTREHLYKAKRVNWRELPKEEWWVEGYLYQNLVKAFIIFPHTGKARNGLFKTDVNTEFSAYVREVESETVCEYTGLTDISKNKIFEGDIIKTKFFGKDDGNGHNFADYDVFSVSYKDGAYLLENSKRQFSASYIVDMVGTGLPEILGNVFDNPELLKGGEADEGSAN